MGKKFILGCSGMCPMKVLDIIASILKFASVFNSFTYEFYPKYFTVYSQSSNPDETHIFS